MAIYRGTGGSGDSTQDTTLNAVTEQATNAASSASAAATSATSASTSASTATTQATAASTSATNAATSATNAATSETNAATSETNAATSETNAATSETNAATSETNASTSATNAATSETNASNSATSASTSATTATTQATTATTQASTATTKAAEALASQTAAAASETSASTDAATATTQAATATTKASEASASATAAATSETNAATSATNAAASESSVATNATNAATSETNAATSETNAATSETNAATSATTATTKASEASTSATNAAASATAAATSATAAQTAETAAETAETNAETAQTAAEAAETAAEAAETAATASETAAAASQASATASANSATASANSAASSATDAQSSEDDAATSEVNAANSASAASSSASAASSSATNAATSATSAAASLASFTGQYSSQATAPSSPTTGDLWFDETADIMKVYDGSLWVNAGSSVNGVENSVEYTATANQTTFSVTYDVGYVEVYLNGIRLDRSDYTATNGTSVVLDVGAAVGDSVFIHAFGTFVLADHYTKVASDARFLNLSGGTLTGDLDFGDNDKAKFGAGDDLQIYHSGTHSYVRDEGTGGLVLTSNGPAVYIQKGDSETIAEFGVDGAVKLRHDNATKLTTTSTGVVVAGTVDSDELTVSGNGDERSIGFNFYGASKYNLYMDGATDADKMHIRKGTTNVATFDASGNVLVGKTSASATSLGVEARANGLFAANKSGGASGYFGRQASDGSIVEFNKDGSTVGSIGYNSGSGFYTHSTFGADSGLVFGSERIVPCTSTGAFDDAVVDLGYTTGRFKDLYLSGGVYLGGTGSANKLDDYEEGTFNLGIAVGSLNSNSKGRYTKVGNQVTVFCQLDQATETTSTAKVLVTGLPFVPITPAFTGHAGNGAISYTSQMGGQVISAVANSNDTKVFFSKLNSGSLVYSDCVGTWSCRFTISFLVA